MKKILKFLVVAVFMSTLMLSLVTDSNGGVSLINIAQARQTQETTAPESTEATTTKKKIFKVGGGDCYWLVDGKLVFKGKSVHCLPGTETAECTEVTCPTKPRA